MPWPRRAAQLSSEALLDRRVAALEADQEAADQEAQLLARRLDELAETVKRVARAVSIQTGTRID